MTKTQEIPASIMWEARELASLFAMPECETSASLAIAKALLARDTAARKECAEKSAELEMWQTAKHSSYWKARAARLEADNAKLREVLHLVGMSAGYQYMTMETRALIDAALDVKEE